MAPLVMRLALRYQAGRVGWPAMIGIHLAGALVYGVVHTAAMLAVRRSLMPGFPKGWWYAARVEFLTQLDWMFMTYLFLVGLAHAFAYRRESEARALDSAHLETRLVEAQLQSLQRQLHPHFLFNTLNTISGLMRTDVNAADVMMDRLGELLRQTLHSSNIQEVTLREELELLQKYVDIEQTRFGPRLTVRMHVHPDALEARVPNLLLQPLVENAVRHGIAPHSRPGFILVEAVRAGERLRIQVRDSGEGVPPDRLTLLNQGVGLANTRARLQHLYRGDHEFVFSNVDGGFCVTVAIPFVVDRATIDASARMGAA
jgi:LytS/YehU family sensor histidine kinase